MSRYPSDAFFILCGFIIKIFSLFFGASIELFLVESFYLQQILLVNLNQKCFFKNIYFWLKFTNNKYVYQLIWAEVGVEPTTFRLWAWRADQLLFSAFEVFLWTCTLIIFSTISCFISS